ncbi:MAG: Flagellin N-methylase [bacterium ADurb.Bin363]|nr:MAG: Flagellin N-methylase [bacterium ADurb.Bin363]
MEIYERTLTTALIEKLSEVINVIEALNLPAGGKETKEILDRIEPVIKCLEERKTSINNVIKAINILKAKFQEIWDKRGIYDNKIRHLWVRLSNLENEYGTNSPKVSKTPLTSYSDLIVTHPYIVKEITFFPESMNINYYLEDKNLTHSVKYKKTILKSIRKFLKDITIFLKNHFTSTIENYIPKCYNCGKCCSIFTVCIAPSDIRRLADEFNISEEEVRKKYIVSPEENVNTGYWNPGSGIIKKTEEKICVFMKKGNLCSIHPFKPGICKQYEPGKRQCYTTIDDDHYYRLLSNIRAVTFNNQTISIITDYTYENFPGPLILNWYDYPLLKNSIEVILSKLKKNLPDLLAKS